MLLLTASEPQAAVGWSFCADVARYPHHEFQMEPLSAGEVAALLARTVGVVEAERLAATYHARSGGNPMLTAALIEDNLDTENGRVCVAADEPAAGAAFARAVDGFLNRRGAQLAAVAFGVAVLGAAANAPAIARLTGITFEAVSKLLDALTAGGLLVDGRFRHPGAADVMMASLPAGESEALRMRAARLLYQRGAPAVDVARPIVNGRLPVEEWLLGVLRDAADEAVGAGDIALAVRSLELYLEHCTDEAERRDAAKRLIRILWLASPSAAARRIKNLPDAERDAADQGLAASLVRHALWTGDSCAATMLDKLTESAAGADRRWSPSWRWPISGSTAGLGGPPAGRPTPTPGSPPCTRLAHSMQLIGESRPRPVRRPYFRAPSSARRPPR